ncbi:MAG TPA: nucleotidyl transferase AbiEii/AbiGii toxin family protein [Verrucomicrobiae bacterium]|jgi:predicted nucleotidyltransferase|nr:nucleotidyl transferase AbiEii/AbiGii toxin family protein [Verrucomicrobiae bacterium]
MDILTALNRRGSELGLQFLVIGGLAINAHGYERVTSDIDLLVRNEEREAWKSLMASLGYSEHHEQGTFMQFTASEGTTWPVDLMFVNQQTFSKMYPESIEVKMKGMEFRVPALEHILALKLHALKYTHGKRELKDLLDVVWLAEINHIDINGEKFIELCRRYGTERIHQQIIAVSSR